MNPAATRTAVCTGTRTATQQASRKILAALLALAGTVTSFAITTAPALAAAPATYVATLAAPLDAPRREVVGDKVWNCEGTRCVARADGSHPLRTCQQVARKFGAVAAFTAPRGDLATEDLARCNTAD